MKLIKSIAQSGIELFGINHLARYLTRNQSRILMYHRVIDHPLVPAITPNQFEQHLVYLSKHFNVIPIDELLQRRKLNTLQPNSVAITFDDGHYDFFENAWPLLKKYKIPATLYITTGFIDRQCWLWPDLLKHILSTTQQTELTYNSQKLSLSKDNVLKTWDIIATDCLSMNNEQRSIYIKDMADTLSVSIDESPSDIFKAVTWQQLREMADEGLDIGSHTVSHRILSKLSIPDKKMECVTSKSIIDSKLSMSVQGLCYPNGQPNDIDEEVISIARESGYSYAVMAYPAKLSDDLFQIGRQAAPSSIQPLRRIVDGLSRKNAHDK